MPALLERSSRRFIAYFLKAYPLRSGLMIGLLILSGLAEGLGLLTLFPMLETGLGKGEEASGIGAFLSDGVRALGVEPTFSVLLVVIVIAISLKGGFLWLAMRQVGYTVARVATDLRLKLIRALMDADWSYYVQYPSGYFTNAVSTEAHRASGAYRLACAALASVIQVLMYATVVFLASWKVAVSAVLVGGLVAFLLRRFIQMSRQAGESQTKIMKSLVARLTEAVPGIKPIKAMAREKYLLPLLENEAEEYNEAQRSHVLAQESLRAFQEPAFVLAIAIGLYVLVVVGEQPLSSVLVLAVLFYRMMMTVNNLQSQYQEMAVGESAFWSMQSYIDSAEAAREVRTGTREPPPLEEGIEIRNVSFSYDDTAVLSDLSLTFPAKRLIAITGPSGRGKTTLVDIAVGLLKPPQGEVLVDGIPHSEIDQEAWRRQVGYVPQEVILFHSSVLRNVTLEDESVSRERVVAALKSAGAWRFVKELPGGIDHTIGERGGTLSGGQRQRIAIARALINEPSLLVLDEGTSALDPATEREFCDVLTRLRGDMTVIAISHQDPIIDVADVVVDLTGEDVTAVSRMSESEAEEAGAV